jgi:hypothetical protein
MHGRRLKNLQASNDGAHCSLAVKSAKRSEVAILVVNGGCKSDNDECKDIWKAGIKNLFFLRLELCSPQSTSKRPTHYFSTCIQHSKQKLSPNLQEVVFFLSANPLQHILFLQTLRNEYTFVRAPFRPASGTANVHSYISFKQESNPPKPLSPCQHGILRPILQLQGSKRSILKYLHQ